MVYVVVDKSTDHAKPPSICFLPQFRRQRKCFFSVREVERELKMALRDTLTCAALSVLLSTMVTSGFVLYIFPDYFQLATIGILVRLLNFRHLLITETYSG